MAWFEHGYSRIYFEDEGRGDPVLVIPGLTMSIDDMRPVREALGRGYRVIAADPPGSGRSGPQPREYAVTYYQDDAQAFLALLEKLEATPAHVVGFSDGGEYALVMAELRPDTVRSIVAWGSVGVTAAPVPLMEAFGRVIDDPVPEMEQYAEYLKAAYGEENARATTRNAAKALKAIHTAGGDISRARAGEIVCPALLITGEHDPMAPPDRVSELAGAMQDAEFVEAKGAGHGVHHERPEWLVDTIVAWLAER